MRQRTFICRLIGHRWRYRGAGLFGDFYDRCERCGKVRRKERPRAA